jgi:formiminoglutamase
MSIPYTTPAFWPEVLTGRFATTVRRETPDGCTVALLGLPDDIGVRRHQGRPGAVQGPAAFRAALVRYGFAAPVGVAWPSVFDAGDITPGSTLDETHARVTAATTALLDAGLLPIAIGGGHDLTFPFVRAVVERCAPLAGVCFDAHLGVRETVGSGMAFRRLMEDRRVTALHLHGFRPLVNSRAHHEWFGGHGGRIYPDDAEVTLPADAENLFASFDLDVLDMAYAPGVSALNPSGWTPREAERWVRAVGADPRVRCFDLMELCPPHDESGRTARLAAHLLLAFLAGYAQRAQP